MSMAPRAGEMEQPLDALRRAAALVGAAVVGLALRRTSGVPHEGQVFGIDHRRALFFRLDEHRPDDLGDHVARAPHDHGVALAHVLAPDLVLVVQRGVGHRDAADEHWLEHGERRDLAGPARVHVDRLQQRRALLGRELVGDRPARRVAVVARARAAGRSGRP